MRLNVFGREIEILKISNGWKVYYFGNEGKKRIANDIKIPPDIAESDIIEYLSDLCHEWANEKNTEVKIISGKKNAFK